MTNDKLYNFKLPDVGEGIHEAEIVRWLVYVGDVVSLNQPILEIQTDKAVVEIPAPMAGTISAINAEAGALVHVGDVVVVIQESGGRGQDSGVREQGVGSREKGRDGKTVQPSKRVLAAPAVRKRARVLGIDLGQVAGSGPAGRVLMDDVTRFAEQGQQPEVAPPIRVEKSLPEEWAGNQTFESSGDSTPSQPPPARGRGKHLSPGLAKGGENKAIPPSGGLGGQTPAPPSIKKSSNQEPLRGLRRSMAQRMELAWRTIPHVTVLEEIDAGNLVNLRKHLQPEAEQRGVRLTYLPFIIKATVQALKDFPYFNASLNMEKQVITTHRHIHIGIATAVDDGLLVPVLRNANRLNVLQLAAELTRLGEAACRRRLAPAELSGSTFTITNFGSFGTAQGTPIINPPEVAVLGCGKIVDKPVAVLGQLEIRPVLPLALSFDHRLLDGAAAGQFMNRLKALLADPNLLFLEMV